MFGFRNITTFIAMIALCLGILEVKNLLNDNFIENDTPVKEALNKFLNGEVPKR